MSSRNVFLTPTQRAAALAISWALCAACRAAHAGEAQRVMARILERAGLETEYAVIRDADTLAPVAPSSTGHARRPLRALIAARAGKTRLIDNAAWAARR